MMDTESSHEVSPESHEREIFPLGHGIKNRCRDEI